MGMSSRPCLWLKRSELSAPLPGWGAPMTEQSLSCLRGRGAVRGAGMASFWAERKSGG